jgi:release factor glutamine methyltransferase
MAEDDGRDREDDRPRRRIPSRPFPKRPERKASGGAEAMASEPEPAAPLQSETGTAAADGWTVGRLLSWTTEFLGKKGAESARLDSEVLLAKALGVDRVWLYTHHDEVIDEGRRSGFRELVKRRADGAPVAYLVGRKEFFQLALEVGPAVLIPRPDTETLVVEFLNHFPKDAAPLAVDVGTGSGAIALACASQRKQARFVAIDASAEALAVARRNAAAHSLSERVRFVEGDLLAPVAGEGPFDAIVSNPPYIATGEIGGLEAGVRDFEPHLALDGGADGLRLVSRLIEQAVPLLGPGGLLLIEIGSAQEGPVRELVGAQAGLVLSATVRDAANHPRVIRAVRAR